MSIKNPFEHIHPDDVARVEDLFHEVATHPGLSKSCEFRIQKKDGTWAIVAAVIQNRTETPGIEGIILNVRDITATRTESELLSHIMDTMATAYAEQEIITDTAGAPIDYRFLRINPAWERMVGKKAADVIGKRVTEVLPGLEPVWIQRYGKVALTGEPATFSSGTQVLGDRTFFVRAWSPAPRRFAVLFDDVTTQSQAETKLKQAEEFSRTLLENSLDLITIMDPNGTITYENGAIHDALGYDPGENVGKNGFEFIHPDDRARVMSVFQQAVASGKTAVIQYRFRRKDGSYALLETVGREMFKNPNVKGALLLSRDVSQQEKLKEVSAEREELERINKLMVGRELRIAELKKENEELKAKLRS